LGPGEAKLWKKVEPDVKPPDYSKLEPGEFKMRECVYGWCAQQIVPNEESQNYITEIGESLIPAHQRELPAGDPLKISCRFYLVKAKGFNAVAYPNGVVLVHSGVFDILQNEAQLAFYWRTRFRT
jgi:predicted Zn-dependent protease